ncbi:uncharacterized protein FIBRA_01251 [Fibroporia radiculosa]|uniref:Trafficking protein particle complex subunit 11 domain-containing protein n=1 Tax=Fibroporia radiculosa TaxID=599839 RepID=J4I8D8_9APHY|nr:uncharacterized protein FIBRA_01251 [Fibroporia radiculosa]CCL99236.1 predicted protein [Fibroporia radiculosa]
MFVGGLDPPQPPGKNQDPFAVLSYRLREALLGQRKAAVWQPQKDKTFQVIIVDKDVRFPPRKLVPPEDPQYHAAHSPLSPLTPTSPLYPDGLIAPIWIRKHTTLVPSVYVVFMRIYESPQAARAPLEPSEADREREAEERRRDTELCADIAQRKRTTSERGVKLTVVLLASRKMLDEPSLDNRLTYIRRQSGLDPRAALFVLSPVSPSEVGDFVRSLQEALYEPAVEYYTNHSKRVRRKRNRHSQSAAAYSAPPIAGAAGARPLRPEGWTVRYEYKMACFAEFRGEDEVALKHYQDAYSNLLIMFGSTAILPPRTKRWAEAKVLADCISLKVCKLYLYNNEHSLALSHHNSHLRKFADFSRGWGIGEETFEFWSWLARQHRAFAELLEQGTRTTLKIPTHYNLGSSSVAAAAAAAQALDSGQRNVLELDAMRALGLNPLQALQHPGFYYYMAARCTERRRERYMSTTKAEEQANTTSPGFTNEKKVDHLALALELYTRSYELFKAHSPPTTQGHGRLTLWIAYRIAQTYFESGKFDMAVRFFERIAKTYRREKWDSLLQPLLSAWYSCAKQMGDTGLGVRLLFEMLGHGVRTQQGDESSTQADLMEILKSTAPEGPVVIESSETQPILDASVVFWKHNVIVNEATAFQLSIKAKPTVSLSALPFVSLIVHFSSDIPPVTVHHIASDTSEVAVIQRIDLGHVEIPFAQDDMKSKKVEGCLRWCPSGTIVFSGSISSDTPAVVKISKVILTLQEGAWKLEFPLHPSSDRHNVHPSWLSSADPIQFIPVRGEHHTSVSFHYRPHRVEVSLSHYAPAYLGEDFPIVIHVTNADDRDMEMIVDALLQPSEMDVADNFISLGDERSTSLVKAVPLGIISPGVSTSVTLYLSNAGAAYDRVVDISVQSRALSSTEPASPTSPGSPTAPAVVDRDETLRTLIVPTIDPIHAEQQVTYRRSSKDQLGLADLRTYEGDFWDDGNAGEAIVTTVIRCMAPSGISVESIKLTRQDVKRAKVLDCSIEQDQDDFLSEWLPGDEFCGRCRISLSNSDEDVSEETFDGPGKYEIFWRRILPEGTQGSLSVSRFPLPQLRPPTDGLVALLDIPPIAKLHVPFLLRLVIRNGHPSRAANVVIQLEIDSSDPIIVSGLRSGRIPIILPGAEETLVWKLIPIECGAVKIPRIKVMDRRKDIHSLASLEAEPDHEGEIVRIVDIRSDERMETSGEVPTWDGAGENQRDGNELSKTPSSPIILVLP